MDTLSSCPHFVYEFVDPRDNSIFYVGITVNLYERYKQHMRFDGTNPQKDQRLQEILASGHLPIMRTIEQVISFEQARSRENWWIWHYKIEGIKLLNISEPRFKYKALQKVKPPTVQRDISNNGREKGFVKVIDMLVSVRETGQWPGDVKSQMQRYYRREYPEFFKTGKKWARTREERIQKAEQMRNDNRPSRSQKK